MKELMTGNEAIARGAWEAGVVVCTAYPGTPSTEIIENATRYPEMYTEWSPNEKVALEVGLGAAIAGGRTLVAMKHVGLNVAADPLFTASYTGVNGGLVVISADDPGLHSSQDEQDNRHYGRAAKLPVLEPADSQECKEFTKLAFDLSERFDTPVILRLTTRVAHSQSPVTLAERLPRELPEYRKDPAKYVMLPVHAKPRHYVVETRLCALADYAEDSPLNRVERPADPAVPRIGFVVNGITYQYARELLEGVALLKLGMTYPLPRRLISTFAQSVDQLYVLEELDPFIEDQLRAWGLSVIGKDLFPLVDELLPEVIAAKVPQLLRRNADTAQAATRMPSAAPPSGKTAIVPAEATPAGSGTALATDIDSADLVLPPRPPVLCPGCPHRAVFYVLNRLKVTVSGDIGCYTLGALPPLQAMDTTICMGASIGVALGMEKARGQDFARRLVAVIGDSTFIHSGITGLIDVVYNRGTTTTLILDNSTTGMTGHQDNPTTGVTVSGAATTAIDLPLLVKAIGVQRVVVVDPFDLERFTTVLQEELAAPEPSVIIAKRPCVLAKTPLAAAARAARQSVTIDSDLCINCGLCLRLGCPSLVKGAEAVSVDSSQCVGCNLCVSLCRQNAIRKAGDRA